MFPRKSKRDRKEIFLVLNESIESGWDANWKKSGIWSNSLKSDPCVFSEHGGMRNRAPEAFWHRKLGHGDSGSSIWTELGDEQENHGLDS